MTNRLPDDVAALLAAVRDGLDLPQADQVADDKTRAALLDWRASDVLVIVASVLKGDDPARAATQLREWIAEHPVTYTPFTPTENGDPS